MIILHAVPLEKINNHELFIWILLESLVYAFDDFILGGLSCATIHYIDATWAGVCDSIPSKSLLQCFKRFLWLEIVYRLADLSILVPFPAGIVMRV